MSGRDFNYTVAPSVARSVRASRRRCSVPGRSRRGARRRRSPRRSRPGHRRHDGHRPAVGTQARARTSEAAKVTVDDRRVDGVGDAGHVHQPACRWQRRHAQGLQADRDAGLPRPPVQLHGQRRPARLDGGQRRVRRPGRYIVPHPGHVPGRLGRERARADPGRVPRCSASTPTRARTSSTSTPTTGDATVLDRRRHDDRATTTTSRSRRPAPACSRSARTRRRFQDPAVTGSFDFTITDDGSVDCHECRCSAGQCSRADPGRRPASRPCTERRGQGTTLIDVSTIPADRLLTST